MPIISHNIVRLLAVISLITLLQCVIAHSSRGTGTDTRLGDGRSFAYTPAKRMHRLRRRFQSLPKPDGTVGAANDDAENLKLLEAFSNELSVINSKWQKAANEELLTGKPVEDFDTFAQRIGSDLPIGSVATSNQSTDGKEEHKHEHKSKQHSELKHDGTPKHISTSTAPQTLPASKDDKPKEEKKPKDDSQPQSQTQKEPKKKEQPKKENQPQPPSQTKPEQTKPEVKSKPAEQSQQPKQEPKQSKPSGGNALTAKYTGQMFDGSMTYYDVGLDACGETDLSSTFLVAVAQEWFDEFSGGDNNPNHNKICGISITVEKNGKKTQAVIRDICPSCDRFHLDMSESLFNYFIPSSVGLSDVKWGFA